MAIAPLVYDRTDLLLTAIVYALNYLPPIVGVPLPSGLADPLPRRRVMASCDVIRMATVGLMAVPGMPLWGLCALLFCTILLGALFFSARAALLPGTFPARHLAIGAAVANTIHQATPIAGFVAGAAVVAVIGANQTLALDALFRDICLRGTDCDPSPPRSRTSPRRYAHRSHDLADISARSGRA